MWGFFNEGSDRHDLGVSSALGGPVMVTSSPWNGGVSCMRVVLLVLILFRAVWFRLGREWVRSSVRERRGVVCAPKWLAGDERGDGVFSLTKGGIGMGGGVGLGSEGGYTAWPVSSVTASAGTVMDRVGGVRRGWVGAGAGASVRLASSAGRVN